MSEREKDSRSFLSTWRSDPTARDDDLVVARVQFRSVSRVARRQDERTRRREEAVGTVSSDLDNGLHGVVEDTDGADSPSGFSEGEEEALEARRRLQTSPLENARPQSARNASASTVRSSGKPTSIHLRPQSAKMPRRADQVAPFSTNPQELAWMPAEIKESKWTEMLQSGPTFQQRNLQRLEMETYALLKGVLYRRLPAHRPSWSPAGAAAAADRSSLKYRDKAAKKSKGDKGEVRANGEAVGNRKPQIAVGSGLQVARSNKTLARDDDAKRKVKKKKKKNAKSRIGENHLKATASSQSRDAAETAERRQVVEKTKARSKSTVRSPTRTKASKAKHFEESDRDKKKRLGDEEARTKVLEEMGWLEAERSPRKPLIAVEAPPIEEVATMIKTVRTDESTFNEEWRGSVTFVKSDHDASLKLAPGSESVRLPPKVGAEFSPAAFASQSRGKGVAQEHDPRIDGETLDRSTIIGGTVAPNSISTDQLGHCFGPEATNDHDENSGHRRHVTKQLRKSGAEPAPASETNASLSVSECDVGRGFNVYFLVEQHEDNLGTNQEPKKQLRSLIQNESLKITVVASADHGASDSQQYQVEDSSGMEVTSYRIENDDEGFEKGSKLTTRGSAQQTNIQEVAPVDAIDTPDLEPLQVLAIGYEGYDGGTDVCGIAELIPGIVAFTSDHEEYDEEVFEKNGVSLRGELKSASGALTNVARAANEDTVTQRDEHEKTHRLLNNEDSAVSDRAGIDSESLVASMQDEPPHIDSLKEPSCFCEDRQLACGRAGEAVPKIQLQYRVSLSQHVVSEQMRCFAREKKRAERKNYQDTRTLSTDVPSETSAAARASRRNVLDESDQGLEPAQHTRTEGQLNQAVEINEGQTAGDPLDVATSESNFSQLEALSITLDSLGTRVSNIVDGRLYESRLKGQSHHPLEENDAVIDSVRRSSNSTPASLPSYKDITIFERPQSPSSREGEDEGVETHIVDSHLSIRPAEATDDGQSDVAIVMYVSTWSGAAELDSRRERIDKRHSLTNEVSPSGFPPVSQLPVHRYEVDLDDALLQEPLSTSSSRDDEVVLVCADDSSSMASGASMKPNCADSEQYPIDATPGVHIPPRSGITILTTEEDRGQSSLRVPIRDEQGAQHRASADEEALEVQRSAAQTREETEEKREQADDSGVRTNETASSSAHSALDPTDSTECEENVDLTRTGAPDAEPVRRDAAVTASASRLSNTPRSQDCQPEGGPVLTSQVVAAACDQRSDHVKVAAQTTAVRLIQQRWRVRRVCDGPVASSANESPLTGFGELKHIGESGEVAEAASSSEPAEELSLPITYNHLVVTQLEATNYASGTPIDGGWISNSPEEAHSESPYLENRSPLVDENQTAARRRSDNSKDPELTVEAVPANDEDTSSNAARGIQRQFRRHVYRHDLLEQLKFVVLRARRESRRKTRQLSSTKVTVVALEAVADTTSTQYPSEQDRSSEYDNLVELPLGDDRPTLCTDATPIPARLHDADVTRSTEPTTAADTELSANDSKAALGEVAALCSLSGALTLQWEAEGLVDQTCESPSSDGDDAYDGGECGSPMHGHSASPHRKNAVQTWERYMDNGANKSYYYNPASRVSQWDRPAEDSIVDCAVADVRPPATAQAADGDASVARSEMETRAIDGDRGNQWERYMDSSTNKSFYFHPARRVSQWHRPDESPVVDMAVDASIDPAAAETATVSASLGGTRQPTWHWWQHAKDEAALLESHGGWDRWLMKEGVEIFYHHAGRDEFMLESALPTTDGPPDFAAAKKRLLEPATPAGGNGESPRWTLRRKQSLKGDKHGEWQAFVDSETHQTFYYNSATGASSWEKPPALALEPTAPHAASTAGGYEWAMYVNAATAQPYYVNLATQETSWEKPADVDVAVGGRDLSRLHGIRELSGSSVPPARGGCASAEEDEQDEYVISITDDCDAAQWLEM